MREPRSPAAAGATASPARPCGLGRQLALWRPLPLPRHPEVTGTRHPEVTGKPRPCSALSEGFARSPLSANRPSRIFQKRSRLIPLPASIATQFLSSLEQSPVLSPNALLRPPEPPVTRRAPSVPLVDGWPGVSAAPELPPLSSGLVFLPSSAARRPRSPARVAGTS